MKKLLLATSIVALTAASAIAQSPSANPPAATATPPAASSATADKPAVISAASLNSSWRSSKLIGLDVYNAQDEKLGDINEILVGKDGKVAAVVIGVGGFLGMGEHDVAVAMDQLKFMEEARVTKTSTTAPASGTNTANTTAPAGGTNTTVGTTTTRTTTTNDWTPDHAVLNATKDQLRAMTAFKYDTTSK